MNSEKFQNFHFIGWSRRNPEIHPFLIFSIQSDNWDLKKMKISNENFEFCQNSAYCKTQESDPNDKGLIHGPNGSNDFRGYLTICET